MTVESTIYSIIVKFTSDAVEVSEWTWRVERSKGLLYSPEYPYFYPSYVNTTYILPQKKGHHTLIMSNDFDLGEEAILEVFETTNKGVRLETALIGIIFRRSERRHLPVKLIVFM